MGATLRTTAIHNRRHRREKRAKLRRQIARATPADRQTFEAKLAKTYPPTSPESHAKS